MIAQMLLRAWPFPRGSGPIIDGFFIHAEVQRPYRRDLFPDLPSFIRRVSSGLGASQTAYPRDRRDAEALWLPIPNGSAGSADRHSERSTHEVDHLAPPSRRRCGSRFGWRRRRMRRSAILFDKFHVKRHLGEALDHVRKSEYGRLAGREPALHQGPRKHCCRARRTSRARGAPCDRWMARGH
jgi:hypothetical protein